MGSVELPLVGTPPQNTAAPRASGASHNGNEVERGVASPPPHVLEPILRHGVEMKVRSGERIFSQGEPASTIFYVRRGLIVSHAESPQGRGLIVLHASAGEFTPLSALMQGGVYASSGVAQKNTQLLRLEAATLRKLVALDAVLSGYFLNCALQRLVSRTEQLKDLAFMDASARVAKLLLRFCESDASNLDPAGYEISDRMIGLSASGMSRETVNRKLRSFAERGLIERRGKKMKLLNIPKLRLIGEGGDIDVPPDN